MKRTQLDDDLASAVAPGDDDDDDSSDPFADIPPIDWDLFTRGGFGIIPLWVVKEIARARAYHASGLIIVILRRLRKKTITAVPITAAIWSQAGSPGKWERQHILQHLRKVPGVLKLEECRGGLARYQATFGEMWSRPRKGG
jgi:hypothetical protein